MSATLPLLPDRGLLTDLCREAAARERVEPQLIEKDYYLTRLLWALGQSLGDALLLMGSQGIWLGAWSVHSQWSCLERTRGGQLGGRSGHPLEILIV